MRKFTFIKFIFLLFAIGFLMLTNLNVNASNSSKSTLEIESVNPVFESSEITVTAPTANAATNIGHTSFQANWSVVKGTIGYALYVYTGSGLRKTYVADYNPKGILGTSTIKTTVSGLSMNTTYYYVLKAIDGSNESDLSNIISVTTLNTAPDAPVATDATDITSTSFTANWNAADGATSYKLTVKTEFGNFMMPISGFDEKEVTETSVEIPNLTPDKQYWFYITAVNTVGASNESNTISTKTLNTAPDTPIATDATDITTTSFTANWEAADGATSYKLTVKQGTYGVLGVQTVSGYDGKEVSGTSFTIPTNTLNPGTNYYYYVTAVNSIDESDESDNIVVTTSTITAPTTIAATSVTDSSFQANWDYKVGVDGYQLYVYTRGKNNIPNYVTGYNPKSISGAKTIKSKIDDLDKSTTYYYSLKAVIGSNESDLSNVISVTTLNTAPDAPVATDATDITTTSFTANWEAADGATSYKLTVTENRGTIRPATISGYDGKIVSGTSYSIPTNTLSSGSNYYYSVVAVNSIGESDESNSISVETAIESPTAQVATSVTDSSFQANWDYKVGVDGYQLYVYTRGKNNIPNYVIGYNPKSLSGAKTIKSTIDDLDKNTTYYYSLKAVIGSNESDLSNVISVSTLNTIPAAPVATAATDITSTSFTANWEAVESATSYKISILSESLGSGGEPGSVEGYSKKSLAGIETSYVVPENTLESGVEYFFMVYAINAAGESLSSNAIKVTTVSQYTLALSAVPAVGGAVSGGETVTTGTSVSATATANEGYDFVNWTEDGTIVSTDPTYTFALNANTTLVANFKLKTGVDNKVAIDIKVWPNPTSNFIQISQIPNGSSIKVTSLIGKVVFQKDDSQNMETVNMEMLKKGIYILIIENKQRCYTKKMIKR